MTDQTTASLFRDLIDYGIRNLSVYRDHVNELNVFPVPDGDTGTNMILTLENGFAAMRNSGADLKELARLFGSAIILGARGNSGVIVSQFFKGFSDFVSASGSLEPESFISALRNGVECSYKAVADPVEGTMLTVMREATDFAEREFKSRGFESIKELIQVFDKAARISLDNTPNLLPVLKSAGVIDSGGAGFCYIFEGMYKYLNNEEITAPERTEQEIQFSDYTKFDRTSSFPLGYCTELLIQLLDGFEPYDGESFLADIGRLGTSIVLSCQDERIKLHIHSLHPEEVLAYCHRYGEFLSLKIENMTVQHTETHKIVEKAESLEGDKDTSFAIVAVANDRFMRDKFFDMGVDVVVNAVSGYNPSSKDFMDAFNEADSDKIFVFPNCKNSYYVAEQAKELYGEGSIYVLETKSVAECYAALAIMDYSSDDTDSMAEACSEVIKGLRTVTVNRAVKDAYFGNDEIKKNDYIAVSHGSLIALGSSFAETAKKVIEKEFKEEDWDVITFFFGVGTTAEEREEIIDYLSEEHPMTDVDVMETEAELYDLIMSFE